MDSEHQEVQMEVIIHVGDEPGGCCHNFYNRLRFALLRNDWFPLWLGILVWSLLHVLLIIVGYPLLVSWLLIAGAFAVAMDLFNLLICYLLVMPVVLVLVLLHDMYQGIICMINCKASNSDKMSSFWLPKFAAENIESCSCSSANPRFPEKYPGFLPRNVWFHQFNTYLKSYSDLFWRTSLRRWCEEVVHMHDVI